MIAAKLVRLKHRTGLLLAVGIGAIAGNSASSQELAASDASFRVISWNISDDAFVSEKQAFRSILRWANPDVVLLDEVGPTADTEVLRSHLAALRPGEKETWSIDVGRSGGRQRDLIATRWDITPLSEFFSNVPYPENDRRRLSGMMSPEDREEPDWSMDGGIPVNGAIIRIGNRSLLAVIADLQCCGSGPESWQELRRRVEARTIRTLIRKVLETHSVDGVIFAGDFNLVNSTFPMALLLGPYPGPHSGLVPAELYLPNRDVSWTWDGRGTPFPSNTLDYQLYCPFGLDMHSGFVVDAEESSPEQRQRFGLEENTSKLTGRHRPLVVEYSWD
ncbi:MAG: endonuclease/exonuclease/phosphatase family protein [Woeseiaceae bacterium]